MVAVVLLVGAFLGSAVSQWWGTSTGPVRGVTEMLGSRGRVRVEVLNAGGISGRAAEATAALRDAGFDVVLFGNARAFDRDSSVVLDRVGSLDGARAVADVLGIPIVRSEPDANLYLDVSVLLGRDWTPASVAQGEATAPAREWWDPRGWLAR
jgi:hypothetical protein